MLVIAMEGFIDTWVCQHESIIGHLVFHPRA